MPGFISLCSSYFFLGRFSLPSANIHWLLSYHLCRSDTVYNLEIHIPSCGFSFASKMQRNHLKHLDLNKVESASRKIGIQIHLKYKYNRKSLKLKIVWDGVLYTLY